ncbi:plasmid mobilization relaxosome protein MobC [Parashewanella curva]|uniref:Plasmid mobilization relaxosome protein MobC n=1 Tax=Parashewanella curva TaxID=2338552 RepID=A0A3L8PW61_9GAMM|nr:plasmid mobilization relaxosome protein MobC [Parashewanella curva]RLV58302.1 plasmid mobilization relaxosome protein MobC [Parashewanella curva]
MSFAVLGENQPPRPSNFLLISMAGFAKNQPLVPTPSPVGTKANLIAYSPKNCWIFNQKHEIKKQGYSHVIEGFYMGNHVVKTRLTDEEKENWLLYCQSSGISQSDMLRMLINRSSPIAKLAIPFNETKSDKVTVRLSEHTLKMLKEQAKYEGYLNQSHWVRAAILSKLRNKPVLSITETDALKESNRQLAAIGRNLNQIARVLNIEFRQSDKITAEMIELLVDRINQHSTKVEDLIQQGHKRWKGVNDELAS